MGGALGILVGYWGRQLLPGPPGQVRPIDWRVLALRPRRHRRHRHRVRHRAGAARDRHERQLGAQGNEPQRRRHRAACSASRCSSCRSRSRWCCSSAPGCSCARCSNLRHVDVGFNPQNLLLFRVNPTLNRYDEKRLPRSTATSSSASAPSRRPRRGDVEAGAALGQRQLARASSSRAAPTRPDRRNLDNSINRLVISPNFFEVMGIPLVTGRGFDSRETRHAPKVVVINEAAARKYFPNENPIGRGSARASRRRTDSRSSACCATRSTTASASRRRRRCTCRIRRRGWAASVFEVRTAGAPASVTARRPRGGAADRSEPAADRRVDADRAGRARLRAGEAVRAGLHAVRRRWRCSSRRSACSA